MTHNSESNFDVQLIWQNIVRRPARWAVPAAVVAVAALGYAVLHKPQWEATQALVMRDEVAGRVMPQGQFASVDDMQTAQGTVLELARSPGVIADALKQLRTDVGGPVPANYPTQQDIEAAQAAVKVRAPGGAEFGRTEVFYLIAKNKNSDKAMRLNKAICDALESRLSQLRDAKAQSLIAELQETVALARGDLDDATAHLSALESDVGGDLAELRILNEASSGESVLRRVVTDIQHELRQEQAQLLNNEQLLAVLSEAGHDTNRLVVTPKDLLLSQPALARLKDGLIDAQLRTAQALGMMSSEHPHVKAAIAEENDVRRRLHSELQVAIRGVHVELDMNQRRIDALEKQLSGEQDRLCRIAGLRTQYNNLSADVQQRTAVWNKAQADLATAKARRGAAHSASLLTRLDDAQTGAAPAGTSRSMIALAGLFGGLLTGLGIVVLTATPVLPVDESAAAPQVAAQENLKAPAAKRSAPPPARKLSLKEALLQIAVGQPASQG